MKKLKKLTIAEFRNRFPDNDACLNHLFKIRFGNLLMCPNCKRKASFKRVTDRRSYQCDGCSYQLYPTAGTVFDKTTTPLTYWFYAVYLFTATRNGVAAKELERQLSICYKTALRMAHQIKRLMMDDEYRFRGEIIIDESYVGGIVKNMHGERLVRARKQDNKTAILGMIDKEGKRVHTRIVEQEELNGENLIPILRQNIDKSSTIVTDGFSAYKAVPYVFKDHKVINHQDGFYAWGGYSTNRIENYWSNLKRMIKGTHIHVSKKHLPKYIAENTFRYVNRERPEEMFDIILSRV